MGIRMNVVVLMSTYNGEKYIKEQIDSILNQENVNVLLMIRDDGSSDNTMAVLQDYRRQYKNIKIIKGKNIGVGNSFMHLLYKSDEADYYAFADQDDVWKKDKLIKGIEMINAVGSDEPLLYVSNQIIVNENMEVQGIRYKNPPSTEIVSIINRNPFSGCTMIMNRRLRNMLTDKDRRPVHQFFNVRIHDAWIAMYAGCVGKIIYDEKSYILYRQHEGNVVGADKKNVMERIRGYLDYAGNPDKRKYRSRAAHQLLKCVDNSLLERKTQEKLRLFDNLNTISGRIRFCKSDLILDNMEHKNLFRMKAMLGLL